MELLRQSRVREADRRAIEEAGIPARVLMETAGRAIGAAMLEELPVGRGVLILCGRGGNGGDGLALLRFLAERGVPARAVVFASEDRLTPENRANLASARALGLPATVDPTPALEFPEGGVVADAMLGGGARGPLRGAFAAAAEALETFSGTVVAVDIPTGLDPDSGRIPGPAARADLTLALAAARRCHFVHPASERCGRVRVLEIGIPAAYLAPDPEDRVRRITAADVADWLPPPPISAHKGTRGKLLLVAGSARMPGAAALAAKGALGAGVGLLTVAAPETVPLPPEAMRLPPEAALEADATALAVGPGLGRSEADQDRIRAIVRRSEQPLVLDADGLFAVEAGDLREGLVLTPHAGEAARLLGRDSRTVAGARLEAARELAALANAPVALKGPGTLVASPDGETLVNPTGGPELAAGGTGDVLAGMVGAFLARGLAPRDALAAGAFLHGRAGEIARERLGPEAVTASAVADAIGPALGSARA